MASLKYKDPQTGEWHKVSLGSGNSGGGGGFVAQTEAPTDTTLLWIDTDDESSGNGGASTADKITVTDETANAFGLEAGATVDETLKKVPKMVENVDKVGDIKVTTRTDLGEKWALCNGTALPINTYPAFSRAAATATVLTYNRTYLDDYQNDSYAAGLRVIHTGGQVFIPVQRAFSNNRTPYLMAVEDTQPYNSDFLSRFSYSAESTDYGNVTSIAQHGSYLIGVLNPKHATRVPKFIYSTNGTSWTTKDIGVTDVKCTSLIFSTHGRTFITTNTAIYEITSFTGTLADSNLVKVATLPVTLAVAHRANFVNGYLCMQDNASPYTMYVYNFDTTGTPTLLTQYPMDAAFSVIKYDKYTKQYFARATSVSNSTTTLTANMHCLGTDITALSVAATQTKSITYSSKAYTMALWDVIDGGNKKYALWGYVPAPADGYNTYYSLEVHDVDADITKLAQQDTLWFANTGSMGYGSLRTYIGAVVTQVAQNDILSLGYVASESAEGNFVCARIQMQPKLPTASITDAYTYVRVKE